MIAVEHRHEYRKNADMYEADDVCDIEALFDAYSIKYLSYASYICPIPIEEAWSREEDLFYQWFLTQERSFEELWEKLTDEAFHLLFGNRSFLLKFNRAVARYLEQETIRIPAEYLGPDGRFKRQPISIWVRDAVYFRDRGRCVLCQVDLSGLLSTDRSDHFDHMVPLAAWGINDPCNIQLLCEACNLKKAASAAITGYRYAPWWSY
jgi:hypothetical protein